MKKAPKRYYNVRLDEETYNKARRIAYKERRKIIAVIRELVLR